jgi:anthranilate synthase component 1
MACLLESVEGGERLARYSFVGYSPYRVLRVGDGPECDVKGDPLIPLAAAMEADTPLVSLLTAAPLSPGSPSSKPVPSASSAKLPDFFGGAIGYVGYDAAAHFEPKTAPKLAAQKDVLGIPEAIFMFCDQMIIFDHARHTIKVVAHARIPINDGSGDLAPVISEQYSKACAAIDEVCRHLSRPLQASSSAAPGRLLPPAEMSSPVRKPHSSAGPASARSAFDWEEASNMGREGYESSVRFLKNHIYEGDIIQAVPSHRVQRQLPEHVSAFDVYRQLRVVNPSPYMFFLDLAPEFQVGGVLWMCQ